MMSSALVYDDSALCIHKVDKLGSECTLKYEVVHSKFLGSAAHCALAGQYASTYIIKFPFKF